MDRYHALQAAMLQVADELDEWDREALRHELQKAR
jgi:hypothetical protein